MIKVLLVGIWASVVALGSVYATIELSKPGPSPEEISEAEFYASLSRIDSSVISVPAIYDGAVQGYFLTEVSYLIHPSDYELFPFRPSEMLNDILITELVGNNVVNFPTMRGFELDKFRQIIGNALNERVGREVFHDILIKRLDYLGKEDIRSNIKERRYDMQQGAENLANEANQ